MLECGMVFNSIINGDEILFFPYDPDTESTQWCTYEQK